jgi:hypothetical protein
VASKFFTVQANVNGEIRVSADLSKEEQKWGAVVRGFTAKEAREFAAQLLKAADRAGG